ncbi:hypothetical protein ACOCHT_18895, partial [Acinetobacter baumannii]
MSNRTPRIRMFAGPNGSGKSTMIHGLDQRLSKLFLNADNLERELKTNPILDLEQFDKRIDATRLVHFLMGLQIKRRENDGQEIITP